MRENEPCRARYLGCSGNGTIAFRCQVEGHRVWMCGQCMGRWRLKCVDDPGLTMRCPGCETRTVSGNGGAALPIRTVVASAPLAGAAAEAIDHAMHMEGILPDVRARVLERLAAEAAWLADAGPSVAPRVLAPLSDALGPLPVLAIERDLEDMGRP
jgi:hypothetical protein